MTRLSVYEVGFSVNLSLHLPLAVFGFNKGIERHFDSIGETLVEIHPDKTRLVNFRRPSGKGRGNAVKGSERPGTFSFLGFTHYWGLSRKGNWVIRRKTAKDRFSKAINAIRVWCRRARHLPIKEQRDTLARKLLGHYAYYGITWNNEGVARFYRECTRVWFKWLTRRSNRHSTTWDDFNRLLKRLKLPLPRIVHSFVPHAAKP